MSCPADTDRKGLRKREGFKCECVYINVDDEVSLSTTCLNNQQVAAAVSTSGPSTVVGELFLFEHRNEFKQAVAKLFLRRRDGRLAIGAMHDMPYEHAV